MNPIKSPREMLFEMAGLPSFGKGKQVGEFGAEMYKLITQAIERYTKAYGKPPNPADVQALKEHVKQLSVKPEIKTDPVTQARARHELSTNPNLINPEGPDPFLMKQMTGRTVKGNWQTPKPQDISNPQVMQNIEAKQSAGALDEILPESTTPSADYMARMSKGVENQILASGETPLIDKLKAAFVAKYKRYPTDEELEVIIAEYNPARHQYGEKGAAIVTERPRTAKGMSDWRQQARMEGIPESYLEKQPADYPKYLKDELELSKGVQPGIRPLSEERINPDRQYADGRSVAPMTPNEMRAMMIAQGATPSKFEDPYYKALAEAQKQGAPLPTETFSEKMMRRASVPFGVMSGVTAAEKLQQGKPLEASLYGASAIGSGLAATRKFMKPGLRIMGAASIPMSVEDAIERYKRGDRTGAVISAIEAAGNAASMFPPTAIPGAAVSMGAGVANAFRDEMTR